MKRLMMIALILGWILEGAVAQEYGCATDEHLEQLLEEVPGRRAQFNQQQADFNAYVANHAARADDKYIIPVVVHVLYNSCEGNISMAQIEDGIRLINEDFNRLNPDTNLTRSPFLPYASNTGVEFRLARLDPDGNPTNGVNRIETPQAVNAQNNVKPLSYWSSNDYMNIWIVESIFNFTGGAGVILGYAQFPGSGSWNTYGLVVRNDAFGTIGTSSADGRTVTHEIGHCLNLYHTFQDGCGGNCNFSGDYVCDTPPAAGATYNCSSGTNTCSNDAGSGSVYSTNVPDQIENYMSYNSCQNLFTEGQKDRMVSALEFYGVLENLVSEDNLIETGVFGLVEADFTSSADIICQFEPVEFSDASSFAGVPESWTFGGEAMPGSSTASNPEVVFPYSGVHEVSYTAVDGDSTSEITKQVFVASTEGQFAPYADDMEDLTFLPSDRWFARNLDGDDHEWKVTNEAAYTGEQSLKLDNYGNCGMRNDELISQSFDFSPYSAVNISFDVAFARGQSSDNVYLRMYSSNDCGESWQLNWARSTSQLQSVAAPMSSPFIPADQSEWNDFTVTLSSGAFMIEGVLIKFEFGGMGGNNLYLDDFKINGTFSGEQLLRAPENGKQGLATDVLIDWKAAGFVDTYEYEIDKVNSFDSQDKISGSTNFIDATPHNEDTEFLAEGLDVATTYFWRVRYNQGSVVSDWSDIWEFTVSETGVGIDESDNNAVKLFPNPSAGKVQISSNQPITDVFVYDYTGALLRTVAGGSASQLDLNLEVSAGVYILHVVTNSGAKFPRTLIVR